MNNIECPYCHSKQDVDHDDGYGYDQDELHQQECISCEKGFAYRTIITFRYDAEKADCLNDGKHQWKPTVTFPKEFTQMQCQTCEDIRGMTEEEKTQFFNETQVSQ